VGAKCWMRGAKLDTGYWMQDAGHCECGARSRMMVTASAEREAGC